MPTKSRWTLPIPRVTLPTYLFTSPTAPLATTPQFLAAENPSQTLSLSTYRLWSQRLAVGLRRAGLAQGEAVLLYSGNTLFFPVVLMGVIMAGGIFTGANPTYNARELAYQLRDSGARFLVVAEGQIDIGLQAAREAGLGTERVFVFDEGTETWEGRGSKKGVCEHWSRLLAAEEEARAFEWEEGEGLVGRTVALNYSSGTTGLPKGVEITHANYVSNCIQHMYLERLRANSEAIRPRQRWLAMVPLYHAMGQTIYCAGAPSLGIPVYIMRRFEFHRFLQHIQDYRISDLRLVPPIVVLMAKHPDVRKYDLSCVASASSGAAPLGREVTVEFEALWPEGQINLKQGYGMTEVTCSCLGWDPEDHCEDFSVGEPNPNCTIKLVDGEGKEVSRGERGEIWVQGPNVMKGYWKNPKATAETLTKDGWLRTGDVAYQDENNRFFVVDRIKELIKVKGLQVAPAELEAQLLEHPGISDACVIGVTVNGEERPRAYVVQQSGQKITPEEVTKFMETKVSRHKRLTGGVRIVDAIAKNPSGKILRRSYREQAQKEVAGSEPIAAKL